MRSATPDRARLLHGLALTLLSIALVGSFWCVPYLPTNDGPESVFAAHMENHYADPGAVYRELFVPAFQFAGLGFTVLFGPLEAWLGWSRGLQVALSVIALVQAWGVVGLVRSVCPDARRGSLAFLGFPLALSWSLYMGFFAFSLASGLGLFVLALGIRWNAPTTLERLGLATLLLLVGVAHVFAAVLTGLLLASVSLARAPRASRGSELGKLLLIGLPLGLLLLMAVQVAKAPSTGLSGAETFYFRPFVEALATWPRTLFPGPLARALPLTLGVLLAGAFALRRILRRLATPLETGLTLAGATFVLASLVAPMHVPGWQCFCQRFAFLGVACLLAALPLERLSRPRLRLAQALLFLGALGSLALSYPFHRRLAAPLRDVLAALAAPVHRARFVLPVSLEPAGPLPLDAGEHEVPYQAPLAHIGPLFATAQGGLSAYTFASNGATWPFVYRPDASPLPPIPPISRYFEPMQWTEFQSDRAFRLALEGDLATYGMRFEGVVVTAAGADDRALWIDRGYVADAGDGSVLLGHFVPCRLDVSLPTAEGLRGLDVGAGTMTLVHDVHPSPVVIDGRAHVVVQAGPCGDVWVRPRWTVDGEDTFCREGTPSGELLGHVSHTQGSIACQAVGGPVPHAP